MKNLIIVASMVGISLFSLQGFSWGNTGHRVVAEIAQRHLTPTVLRQIKEILGGLDLADVANWADEIRGDAQYSAVSPLHFADIPAAYKTYESSPRPAGGDVVVAIKVLTSYLKTGDQHALSSVPALASMDQVQALKLLVHFVGDVHQPLHCGDTADLGGNTVKVNWMNKWASNLHSIWDDEMIDLEQMSYRDYAGFLERTYKNEAASWASSDVVAWADESVAARPQIYVFPDKQSTTAGSPVYIGYSYIDESRDLMRTRLYQGGIRLGQLLNSIFSQTVSYRGKKTLIASTPRK